MQNLIYITIICYILSTFGYFSYLFVQKDEFQKAGYYILGAGFFFHSVLIIYNFVESGHAPVRNLHETLLLAGWAVAGVFLFFRYRFNLKILGIYAAPLAALVIIASSQLPIEPVQTKSAINSFWVFFHVIVILIGEAAFALACGVGVLYLLQEHAIKTKNHGFFFRRLPSLELLDSTGYASIVVGFTMLTLGLIAGFIYAKSDWGHFFSRDPKEIWSGITWLFYAALLHARLAGGWRGRKAAVMSIIGFAVLMFTFFGVNFLMEGHHKEFTWR